MNDNSPTLQQLRGLIGQTVNYRGHVCCVIEILSDGPGGAPSLVLQDTACLTDLQDNQYGGPGRSVPRTYTVPLRDEDGTPVDTGIPGLRLPPA